MEILVIYHVQMGLIQMETMSASTAQPIVSFVLMLTTAHLVLLLIIL